MTRRPNSVGATWKRLGLAYTFALARLQELQKVN
jgi:hypothetical protein